MDPFSYLSVLLSIILGLGITQVLTAMGRIIRGRSNVTTYWPPLLWAAVLLVIYVQVWWSMFGLREREDWSFLAFFVVLLQCVALYMAAAVLLPEDADQREHRTDLRAHYERHSAWFFGFIAATGIVSITKEVVLEGRLPEPGNMLFHIFLLSTTVTAMFVKRERFHQLLALTSAVAIALYIAVLFSRLA